MTDAKSRMGGIRGAVAVFLVLYAAAALVIIATASPSRGAAVAGRLAEAASLDQSPLGRWPLASKGRPVTDSRPSP